MNELKSQDLKYVKVVFERCFIRLPQGINNIT